MKILSLISIAAVLNNLTPVHAADTWNYQCGPAVIHGSYVQDCVNSYHKYIMPSVTRDYGPNEYFKTATFPVKYFHNGAYMDVQVSADFTILKEITKVKASALGQEIECHPTKKVPEFVNAT
ncbi:BgTH12-05024 [Blumeria graminis f. sp. triticale]|uniref:BgTH12-05024 n=1 Tax=Blumeria graminis f. sp. triticale TaxID=1689686 RepID=A0A9W4GED0_BLUGR|nr:BgTH12-05024 [Blumeria graminis f. sp. triticale]